MGTRNREPRENVFGPWFSGAKGPSSELADAEFVGSP
jgi:hypothetical protein